MAMESLLRAETASTTLPCSTTNSYLADDIASTCSLLTPSPPTNDLINPLPENEQATFSIGEELATKLQHVQDDEKEGGDSASSSSSALAEPSCVQLLNHRHVYHHITKDENASLQETNGKVQPLQLTFKNPPDDYCFMKWNWPLIRKISWWIFLSGLIAMLALVVAMVASLPKTCNPPVEWYQGGVFYEISPASFSDSNDDNIGDFTGISLRVEYLQSLNITAIRLNSIFKSPQYPEDYQNISSLVEVAPELGNMQYFKLLVDNLHLRNMFVVLDLPLWPLIKELKSEAAEIPKPNMSEVEGPHSEFLRSASQLKVPDDVSDAILYWLNQGVDGFYLKGLENYVDDINFAPSLRRWRKILGQSRPIIVSHSLLQKASSRIINVVLNNVDLIDIKIQVENGVAEFSKQISNVLNGTFFSKPGMPWVHWNLGDESRSLANRLAYTNTTLGVILLQLMLPGTPSIFFGDEFVLKRNSTSRGVVWQHSHMNHATTNEMINLNEFNETTRLISKMIELRRESPSIYVNSVKKDGSNKVNVEVKYVEDDLVVMQRWYPRRKSYVVVTNLGSSHKFGDVSGSLYTGEVVMGPRIDSKPESVMFERISLWPGESVVVLLH